MKNVIIIGTGGHAKVIADIVQNAGDRIAGFLTSDRIDRFLKMPVLGRDTDFEKYPDSAFIIAIGDQYARARIVDRMRGVDWYTAIHPKATVSSIDTAVGPGTVIMANAVVNPGAVIGRHCIVNSSSLVEHDNGIGDFVHIAIGAKLAGTVTVGPRTWIGAGAVVKNNVSICGDCMIGAGAVVVRDILEPGTYVGVPARKMEKS